MAIITTPCSCGNNSSSLQKTISISCFHPKNPCLKIFNTLSTSSSLSLFSITPKNLHHANSSSSSYAQAAIEQVTNADAAESMIIEFERLLSSEESDDGDEGKRDSRNRSSLTRRKMRRKRRNAAEMNKNTVCLKNGKSDGHFLTKKAEADYSFCLKEEARVVALRKKIEETSRRKLTSAEWAATAGMSKYCLDMIICNGREAEERIIRCYTKLVASIALTHLGRGLTLEDLIQEGNIGLLRGAKKFNPEKGCKLSTYVYWWIRQEISKAINKSKIIKLPSVLFRER